MSIDQAYQFVQFVYNKSQNGNITPGQFNVLAPTAQISIINQYLGNEAEYVPGRPIARNGFLLNQKNLVKANAKLWYPNSRCTVHAIEFEIATKLNKILSYRVNLLK